MKKGFTLLELIVSMAIIAIISSITILSVKNTCKLQNTIDVESTKRGILNIVLNSKDYCYCNKVSGHLLFDLGNEEIRFYDDSKRPIKIVYRYTLPQEIKLVSINSSYSMINIGREGGLEDACTIYFKDRYKNSYTVTICVGSFMIDVK